MIIIAVDECTVDIEQDGARLHGGPNVRPSGTLRSGVRHPTPVDQLLKLVRDKLLADIQPELVLPDQKKTVADLLVELKESSDVVGFMDYW